MDRQKDSGDVEEGEEMTIKIIHLESRRVAFKVEQEMTKGKSLYEALAMASIEARDRQERQKKSITGIWLDEANPKPIT